MGKIKDEDKTDKIMRMLHNVRLEINDYINHREPWYTAKNLDNLKEVRMCIKEAMAKGIELGWNNPADLLPKDDTLKPATIKSGGVLTYEMMQTAIDRAATNSSYGLSGNTLTVDFDTTGTWYNGGMIVTNIDADSGTVTVSTNTEPHNLSGSLDNNNDSEDSSEGTEEIPF